MSPPSRLPRGANMKRIHSVLPGIVLACVAVTLLADDKPVSPKDGVIKLFNGKDLTGWTTWLKDSKREDPKKVFGVQDGMIRIAGMPMGYLATDKAYENYH